MKICRTVTSLPLALGALLCFIASPARADLESEIQAYEAHDVAYPPPAKPVLFVGSSSIRIWPNLSGAFPGLPVLNRGFGGSQMSDVLTYFPRIVAAYHPAQIVIYEGDNDLAGGKSVAQVFGDYSNFLARVEQQLPGTKVSFLSIKPSPSRVDLMSQMEQVNALVRTLAESRGQRFIDVYNPMLNQSGLPRPELFQSDMLHMNSSGYVLWQSIIEPVLAAAAVPPPVGGTFLFDFGAALTPVGHGPAPDDPVNYWNNVGDIGTQAAGQLINLVTTQNTPSPLRLAMISRFNGVNEAGTTVSTIYPVNGTRDSLFGNTEIFGDLTNIYPSFKITGLDTQSVVSFTFYASRGGVSDNRETGYTVQGATAGFAALNVANNVDATATVSNIVPTDLGEITISLAPTTNNNNANHFTYLGVLKMDVVPPQTPIVFTLEPVNTRALEFQPVTFSAAVAGAPPYFVQWMTNGVPVPGANQFNYVIDSATLAMDGTIVSVSVANLSFSAVSSNAVLRVVTDFVSPEVVSVTNRTGLRVELTFSEALDVFSAEDEFNYAVNEGEVTIQSAVLQPNGRTVFLELDARISGTYKVVINSILDLSGNSIASDTTVTSTVPGPESQVFLIDFGGPNTTLNGVAPDDPINFWNNVTTAVGTTDNGQLLNLVTGDNTISDVGLVMLSRFNGANENGTLTSTLYPADATRDSLFGNTEGFSGFTNIFPKFKLVGLDPALNYNFNFYASRTGVGDNRTTGYTVEGANPGFGSLNVANNTNNTVTVAEIRPTAAGEITISLAPTAANNNGNHFTYLGVLRMQPSIVRPHLLQPVISGGRVTLTWTGGGRLQSAPTVTGPWTTLDPAPASPHSEDVLPTENKFYRVISP